MLPRRVGKRKIGYLALLLLWAAGVGFLWWWLPPQPRATLTPSDNLPLVLVGFSPDGRTLATRTVNQVTNKGGDSWTTETYHGGPIRLWDASTGREQFALAADWNWIPVVVFSPDGKLLAGVHAWQGGELKLWDVAAGQELAALKTAQQPSMDIGLDPVISFSPDGNTLALVQNRGQIELWDVASRQTRAMLPGSAMAFSPDGQTLATYGRDEKGPVVKLWDVTTGHELPRFQGRTDNAGQFVCTGLAFSPDGKTLASLLFTGERIQLWDLDAATERDNFSANPVGSNSIVGLKFAGDGNVLVVKHMIGITAWDVSARPPRRLYVGFKGPVLSPDGKLLAKSDTGERPGLVMGHPVDPATYGTQRRVDLKEVPAMQSVAALHFDLGADSSLEAEAFSPDGRTLAVSVGSFRGKGTWRDWLARLGVWSSHEIRLFDVTTLREQARLPDAVSVLYSPDGTTIAAKCDDETIRVWDAHPGRPIVLLVVLSAVWGLLVGLLGWLVSGRLARKSAKNAPSVTRVEGAAAPGPAQTDRQEALPSGQAADKER
jgi:WD40 repeat protein